MADVLVAEIIHECIEKLLGQIDDYQIEGICILLNVTGEALDKGSPDKVRKEKVFINML